MNNDIDRLLTANELADFLDVPIRTLYAWRYRGEGPVGFRAGKHLRCRRCDIQRWIEQQIDTGASAFRVTDST